MKKVALIQNRIQPGGRFQVMAEMILVLNQKSIVPDVLCFRSSLNVQKAQAFYGDELKFNLRIVSGEFPMPFEWNIYWFNVRVSSYLDQYDLVINHNNTSFGLKAKQTVFSYVHYPRKSRLNSGLRDIHAPEKGNTPWLNAGRDLFNLAKRVYRYDDSFNANETLVANSQFTKKALLDAYTAVRNESVEVLYPPVNVPKQLGALGEKNQLVSLGRIAKAKRQLEQIKIAEKLSDLHLTIIGFVAEDDYYKQCKDYVKQQRLENVSFLPNASKGDMDETLSKATFFIHCMRNEPFGITPVQAIAKGCIPLVHDSGGQREVVPNNSLRYGSIEDAATKLQDLMSRNHESLNEELFQLQNHIRKYDTKVFAKRFEQMLLSLQP